MSSAMMAGGPAPSHLLVVSLVLSQDLFSHFLFPLVDIRVKLVPVLSDRELLVIIDWDKDFLCANWLFIWVMELSHVRMLQCLLGSESFCWVELQKILQKIQSVVGGSWEHVSQFLWLGRW